MESLKKKIKKKCQSDVVFLLPSLQEAAAGSSAVHFLGCSSLPGQLWSRASQGRVMNEPDFYIPGSWGMTP